MSVFLILGAFLLKAQSNIEIFRSYSLPSDSLAAKNLLYRWEKTNPEDADLYISYFNYYFKLAQNNLVSLGTNKANNGFALEDSSGKRVGYLSGSMIYNSGLIDSGITRINQGISKHPKRLDMRFGKIYVLRQTEQYASFTKELIQTIALADSIKYKWLTNGNQLLPDPEEYFLGTVQEYIHQLYDAGDEYLPDMREVAEEVLKYHPNDVRFLSDVAVTYSLQNEADKSLSYLLRAEKIAPKDFIILNNIARTYEQMKDLPQAIKYHQLVVKHGDEDAKIAAKKKIKDLKQEK